MSQQQPKKRGLSLKAMVVLALLFLFSGAAAYVVYDFYQGPPKPWYAKWQIKRYLKQQTGQSKYEPKFNLNLAQDVAKLEAQLAVLESGLADYETNATRLRGQVLQLNRALTSLTELQRRQAILTNRLHDLETALARVPEALTNLPPATLTNLEEMHKELESLRAVVQPVLGPLQPLREEIAALEKQLDERQQAQAPLRRELNTLQQQIQSGKRLEGTNQIELAEADLTAASNRVAEIRASLEAASVEAKPLQEQFAEKQRAYDQGISPVAASYRTLRWLNQRVSAVGALQTNVNRLRLDISTTEQDLAGRLKDLGVPLEVEALKKAAADRQGALAEMDKKHQQQITERASLRRDVTTQKNQLAAQQADITAQFRQRLNTAKTYREMYIILGEQLTVADQLLSKADTNQQRMGLLMAMSAAYFCSAPFMIENYWLTARIGEAYLLPNRYLANEPNRKPPLTPDAVVQQCIAAYRGAHEPQRIIELLRYSLSRASTPREADQVRLALAQEYEQVLRVREALQQYQALDNKTRWVSNKIVTLERRLK